VRSWYSALLLLLLPCSPLRGQSASDRPALDRFQDSLAATNDTAALRALGRALARERPPNALRSLRAAFASARLTELGADSGARKTREELRRLTRRQPDWPYAWHALALAETRRAAWERANPVALGNRIGTGTLERALRYEARALAADPTYLPAALSLADLALDLQDTTLYGGAERSQRIRRALPGEGPAERAECDGVIDGEKGILEAVEGGAVGGRLAAKRRAGEEEQQQGRAPRTHRLHSLLSQEPEEVVRRLESGEPLRYVGVFGELRDLAQDREILIRDLEGRGHDQKEIENRAVVDSLVLHALPVVSVGQADPVDDQGAAMGNRDSPAHAGRAQRLAALEHPEQRVGRTLVEAQQADELREDLVLAAALEVDRNGVRREELGEVHSVAAT
jgi:hypothetical protein